MVFENPDPTFAHQADRVEHLYRFIADIRDKHSSEQADARHVNLNNMMMAANVLDPIERDDLEIRILFSTRHLQFKG